MTVLLVVFVVLKMTDNVDWSWMWVLSPLWIFPSTLVAVLGVSFTVVMFSSVWGSIRQKRNLSKRYKAHRDAQK